MIKNLEGYLGITLIIGGVIALLFSGEKVGIIGMLGGLVALSSWECVNELEGENGK